MIANYVNIIAASRRRALSYRDTVLADNPVAYWRLGESSGTTAVDEMGSYPGTYVGSPTLGVAGAVAGDTAITTSAGKRAESLSGPLSGVLPITYEAWVKTVSPTSQNIVSAGVPTSRSSGISLSSSGTVAAYSNGGGGAYYGSPSIFVRDGEWHHVVGVIQTTGITLHVDGVLIGTLNQSISSATGYTVLKIGSWIANSDPLIGSVDEVAIYNAALSAERIAAHYAARNNA